MHVNIQDRDPLCKWYHLCQRSRLTSAKIDWDVIDTDFNQENQDRFFWSFQICVATQVLFIDGSATE